MKKQSKFYAENQFQALFDQSPNAIYLFDTEGRFLKVNRVGQDVLGVSEEEVLNLTFEHCVIEADQERAWGSFKLACAGQTVTDELSAVRHGEIVDLHITKIPVLDNRVVVSVFIIAKDITARRRSDLELKESEQRYRSLFENNSNPVVASDLQGHVLNANQAYLNMTGYSFEELMGMHVSDLIPSEYLEEVVAHMSGCRDGKPQYFESKIRTKDGRILDIEMDKLPIVVKGEITGFYTIARDITEKKRAEALIQHLAYYDSLTDLPNRLMFRQRLTDALQKEKGRCALLFLDLDQFKNVNDTLGHSAGDELLKLVSKRIAGCLSKKDTLSRSSGDEFIVLLQDIEGAERAHQVAKCIIEGLKEPFALDGHLFYMTCSIGIVLAPEHGDNPEVLMQHADTAMYFAKEQGKNTHVLFHPHMSRRMARRIELEGAMRKAIGNEEFSLCYQPQVCASTKRVYGAEALIRWITPQGTLSPAEFIPLAEETGLIVELGAWVLRSACLQARAWREQGLPEIRVSVNLSSRQFQDPHFLPKVKAILSETGSDPEWIGLEITESLIMGNVGHATQTLQELRGMGFEISIDDFGTGYSSLAYLKTFPIHKLKIDQQFVRDVTSNEEDKAITKAIIALAKILGLKVVAEGVETEAHVRLLSEEGCDELQGYFFSKPVPAPEFERMLRTAK